MAGDRPAGTPGTNVYVGREQAQKLVRKSEATGFTGRELADFVLDTYLDRAAIELGEQRTERARLAGMTP